MAGQLLNGQDRDIAIAEMHSAGWQFDADTQTLSKSFAFTDFNAAFGWMSRVALMAEKLDHHPDWTNSWNRVDVRLTTHRPRGFTTLDVALAQAMDQFAQS